MNLGSEQQYYCKGLVRLIDGENSLNDVFSLPLSVDTELFVQYKDLSSDTYQLNSGIYNVNNLKELCAFLNNDANYVGTQQDFTFCVVTLYNGKQSTRYLSVKSTTRNINNINYFSWKNDDGAMYMSDVSLLMSVACLNALQVNKLDYLINTMTNEEDQAPAIATQEIIGYDTNTLENTNTINAQTATDTFYTNVAGNGFTLFKGSVTALNPILIIDLDKNFANHSLVELYFDIKRTSGAATTVTLEITDSSGNVLGASDVYPMGTEAIQISAANPNRLSALQLRVSFSTTLTGYTFENIQSNLSELNLVKQVAIYHDGVLNATQYFDNDNNSYTLVGEFIADSNYKESLLLQDKLDLIYNKLNNSGTRSYVDISGSTTPIVFAANTYKEIEVTAKIGEFELVVNSGLAATFSATSNCAGIFENENTGLADEYIITPLTGSELMIRTVLL